MGRIFVNVDAEKTTTIGEDGLIRTSGKTSVSFLGDGPYKGPTEKVVPDDTREAVYSADYTEEWSVEGKRRRSVGEKFALETYTNEKGQKCIPVEEIADILSHGSLSDMFDVYMDPELHEGKEDDENGGDGYDEGAEDIDGDGEFGD